MSAPARWSGISGQLPGHAGLWLDRYLQEEPGDRRHEGRRLLYEKAIVSLAPGAPAAEAWQALYPRWVEGLSRGRSGVRCRTAVATTKTRLLLQAATERTVTEGGVLLHHTYGVPYLPGSSLKGVLRAALGGAARGRVNPPPGLEELLFGDEDRAGLVDLPDALWVPRTPARHSPLALDVVNPHHPAWYTGAAREAPSDMDDPVPTQRLTIRPGTRFLVAVELPERVPEAWGAQLLSLLGEVLLEDGVGAWTSAGYGRLSLDLPAPTRAAAPSAAPGQDGASSDAAEWMQARLSGVPGKQQLRAVLLDGRQAEATGAAVGALLAALPETLRGRLQRGPVDVDVQVEALGLRWRLTGVRGRG